MKRCVFALVLFHLSRTVQLESILYNLYTDYRVIVRYGTVQYSSYTTQYMLSAATIKRVYPPPTITVIVLHSFTLSQTAITLDLHETIHTHIHRYIPYIVSYTRYECYLILLLLSVGDRDMYVVIKLNNGK